MLGIKTVGNATLIALDEKPILVTDPWFGDEHGAYFGSWGLPYTIPPTERQEILDAKYVWFSHGHPDHLNPHSIEYFKAHQILVPDHVGKRIKTDLSEQGFNVSVLPDRRWTQLSKRIKVFCITDYNQDAVLLVDVNGKLFLNLNDSSSRACFRLIRKMAGSYKEVFLLKLAGYGDADMINFIEKDGTRVEPFSEKPRVGQYLSDYARSVGANRVIPFSSLHRYQREDSVWANDYLTPLAAYKVGFDESVAELIEPFVFINCASDERAPIKVEPIPLQVKSPAEFGDDWSQPLEKEDRALIDHYFKRKERLRKSLAFIEVKAGGVTHCVDLEGPDGRGITFEAPRNSLMQGIGFEVFDDLLIGNFMKTTLHNVDSLYDPEFTRTVAKFADNGRVETEAEIRQYMKEYARRAGPEWLLHICEKGSMQRFRRYVSRETWFYKGAKRIFYRLRSRV